jgi:hypothetical protein
MKSSIVAILTSFTTLNLGLLCTWSSVVVAQDSSSMTEQCNQLVIVINQSNSEGDAIEPPQSFTNFTQFLERLSSIVARTIITIENLQLSNPRMQQFQQGFIARYEQGAQSLQDLLAAIRTEDADGEQLAMNRIEALGREEDTLVNEVNQFCSRFGSNLIQLSKTEQCNQLIEIANHAVSEIETITSNTSPLDINAMQAVDINAMQAVADTADRATSALSRLYLSDLQLRQFQQRFLQMHLDISRATSSLITAVEQDDSIAFAMAYENLQSATALETPLVEDVNLYCDSTQNTSE